MVVYVARLNNTQADYCKAFILLANANNNTGLFFNGKSNTTNLTSQ